MKPSKIMIPLLIILTLSGAILYADVGVIIPLNINVDKPDSSILSLYRMELNIVIDNGYATVKVLQVFFNHTDRDLEGQFIFAVPTEATISDFAVWDNQVRIPGVVMEKKRARQLYEELTTAKIDPGLLETMDDETMVSRFRAKIYPIPAGGSKRLEMEYTQELDMSLLKRYFNFPLKPTFYDAQTCGVFKVNVKILSNHKISNFKKLFSIYPLQQIKKNDNELIFEGEANNVKMTDNFAFEYTAEIDGLNFDFLTYRSADRYIYDPDPFHGYKYKDTDGYFLASVIYNVPPSAKVSTSRDMIILLDISLSMQWKRLEQAYNALEYFIKNLQQGDRLQVILFNDEIKIWGQKPIPVSPERAQEALDFVKSSYLTGGTDLLAAIKKGLEQVKNNPHVNEPYLVIITDGNPTINELRYKQIEGEIIKLNKQVAPDSKREFIAHLYIYGVGDNTNVTLLERLVEHSDGFFTWVGDSETADYKLRSFLEKIGADIIRGINLIFEDAKKFSKVYPNTEQKVFNGSAVSIVGRYLEPRDTMKVTVTGKLKNRDVSRTFNIKLPEKDILHSHLPRAWAKARVEELLRLIRYEGEKEEWINEVIALAKQYKFVTPYTSFLAAPRALLRPRVIKPGDPVLRIKTDPAIIAVVAQFPFNLTKPMRYIKDEDTWEVRFLAPREMNDGSYSCNLVLQDIDGNIYREKKSFIIDSRPPTIIPSTDRKTYSPGDTIKLIVRTDADTRTLKARFNNGLPVDLRYRTDEKASVGEIIIPKNLPTGSYKITFSAEDFAHNISANQITVEIIGG